MNKDKKLIPELRFPEFLNDEEWAEKLIGDITISESSSMALNKLELKPKGYPVYGADSIVGYIDDFQQEEKYISIVKDGSGVGRLNLCQSHSSILGTLVCLKSKNKKLYYLDWIYYLLNTVDFSVYVKGAGIPHIYYSDFKFEKISVPNPTEQQKIASCLSSLDEVIAAHGQKLDLLKDHKKGLMQNLFPQEGEKVPKFRFPEFNSEIGWEFLNGDKLFETISNKNHNSDLPILAITQEQGAIPRDMIDYHVSVTDKSVESYKVVEIGDFILSLRSFQGGIEYSNYIGLCSPAYIILRKKKHLINDFYRHYFKSFLFIQNLNKNLEGIRDGKIISYKQFSEILIPKPKTKEQQKIASCLSSLDVLITAQTEN
jgi:type I restriction enzyme S subunit